MKPFLSTRASILLTTVKMSAVGEEAEFALPCKKRKKQNKIKIFD